MPLELIQRVHISLRARHHHVFVNAIPNHTAAIFLNRHGDFTLRIEPRRHRMDLVLDEFTAGFGQL